MPEVHLWPQIYPFKNSFFLFYRLHLYFWIEHLLTFIIVLPVVCILWGMIPHGFDVSSSLSLSACFILSVSS